MNENKHQEKENEELRLLYQITIGDIENAKRRQWSIVYYILLSFAALIGFYSVTKANFIYDCWYQKLCLLLPTLFVNFFGIYLLMDFQKNMCKYRMRLCEIGEEFEPRARKVLKISVQSCRLWRYQCILSFILSMTGVVFLSLILL